MKLSILIPALTRRDWRPLADNLRLQATQVGGVEVLVEEDDGSVSSGAKRNVLMQRATGEYVTFVDDDDWVSDRYVSRLTRAIRDRPDVVTFDLSYEAPGRLRVWSFGLGNPDGARTERARTLMKANHLCAWRRDLAGRVAWCNALGYGDDQLWYGPMLASGLAKTEVHVDECLYRYRYSPAVTVNQTSGRIQAAREYFGHGIDCWWAGNEIAISLGSHQVQASKCTIDVRLSDNTALSVPRTSLRWFHTVVLR